MSATVPTVFAPNTGQIAYDVIPLSVDADIDFRDVNGPTGGICPRGLYATTAGDIVLTAVGVPGGEGVAPPAPAAQTVPFGAKELRWIYVTGITDSGTTAGGILAYL